MKTTTPTKKPKLLQKSDKNINKKLKTKKKLKKPISTKHIQPQPRNNDSDSSESDSENLPKLLEPYSKDQLIDLISDAALKDPTLFARIREAADRDVSHRNIFVHGLGWDTTRESLVSSFGSFGEIEDCNLVTDKNTGLAKGYGFVLFKTRQGAKKALKNPRKMINSRLASCQLASLGHAGPAQSKDMSVRKIYVSNVNPDVNAERLRAFFAKFGEIEIGPIGFDTKTGKSRGFAIFVYKTNEGAKKVLEEPHMMFEGHQLHCRIAADGKVKKAQNSVQAVQVPPQPVQPPVLAASQNLGLLRQNPSLYPVYGGLLLNPGAGLFGTGGPGNATMVVGALNQAVIPTSQVGGSVGGVVGLSGYGGGSNSLGNLGASSGSVLGTYGSDVPLLQGLQNVYSNRQLGQLLSGRKDGAGGSLSGHPSSYLWVF